MISLPTGVKIIKFYDSEMQKVGKGILYLLNNGILFEKKGEGVKFECNFDYLASFEAVKKDKLLVVMRTPQGRRSIEFKVNPANQVEYDIAQTNQEYAKSAPPDSVSAAKNTEHEKFDHDVHSNSEAKWFQDNWDDIMKFLKPERVTYLNEYVKNAKIGTPDVDPFLLVVKHENLTYKDFADLPEFLKWRYDTMTEKEVNMIVEMFRDFDEFSVSTLEMQVKRASKSKNYLKFNRSLYEHVSINSREIEEELKTKKIKT